jgi:hypothetical protein
MDERWCRTLRDGGNPRAIASCLLKDFLLALTQLRHRPSRTESKDTRRHLLILVQGCDPIHNTSVAHFNDEGRRQGCEDRVQGKPVFPVQGHLNTWQNGSLWKNMYCWKRTFYHSSAKGHRREIDWSEIVTEIDWSEIVTAVATVLLTTPPLESGGEWLTMIELKREWHVDKK